MKRDWDAFWSAAGANASPLRRFLSFYRRQIIARSVDYYINKHFKPEGVFVECGAGTSETSLKTQKKGRTFVALDYSAVALRKTIKNPQIDSCINADIFSLPFRDGSIDGVWNVGVMEHFSMGDIEKILKEFRRVIKRDGKIILFWPMAYAPYEIFINVVEFVVNKFPNMRFQFYPDEVSRLKSRRQGREILRKSDFNNTKVYFNFRDAFSFGVVVGTK